VRNAAASKPTHVTRDYLFRDLVFSPDEALALEFKARILDAILDEVKRKKYRQAQLVEILDEYQPVVSNLMRGKISQMSIEKLLIYAHHLGLSLDVRRSRDHTRRRRAA